MSENTDRSERMTGTPSKDRAEARTARDVIRSCLFGTDKPLADEIVAALAFEGFEVVHPNERATCYRDGFAEGMKRAAEIAHMFRNRDTGRAIEEAILAEISEAK